MYRISSSKSRASNKRRLLISTAPLGTHIEISTSSNKRLPSDKPRTSKYSAY